MGPLINEVMITKTDWNTKEESIQPDFFWTLETEAAHQIIWSKYGTVLDKKKLDNLFKLYNK